MSEELGQLTDVELLTQWRGGDRDAGGALLVRYDLKLYRFFTSKVDGDVDDLVQSTFETFLKHEKFDGRSSFRTYLFAIAHSQLCRYYRSRSRMPLDFSVSSLEDLGITPRTRLMNGKAYSLLERSLRALPIEQQVLLEYYYWEGMSVAELADTFAISRDATNQRLTRARRSLRKQYQALQENQSEAHRSLEDLDGWARSLRELLTDIGTVDEYGEQNEA